MSESSARSSTHPRDVALANGYRVSSIRTMLDSHYPCGSDEAATEVTTVVHLVAIDFTNPEIVTEKIDHGRKTRRFGIERAELRYCRTVRADHRDGFDEFEFHARDVPWRRYSVSTYGKAVRANGTRGSFDGFYRWPRVERDVPMPHALAKVVGSYDQWFEIS